jgi:hypothetical protein
MGHRKPRFRVYRATKETQMFFKSFGLQMQAERPRRSFV